MVKPIPQMEPWYGEEEAEALAAYMRSGGWGTEFRQTEHFEAMLRVFTEAQDCVATTSGTAALILALFACDIGPGDEVIVPDLTMIATANAVRFAGAKTVFADVDPETLNLDIDNAMASVTTRTRAIIHVSLNGRSNDLVRLAEACRERCLILIEDAAQSLGSFHSGRHLGTWGDLGCLSFSPHKIVSTGQGGAVLASTPELAAKIRKLKDFGRVKPGVDVHDMLGFNFKFNDILATVGIEQMRRIETRMERKKAIWRQYREQLVDVDGLHWLDTDIEQVTPWFMDIYVENREGLMAHLKSRGIGSRPIYPPIHSQPAYGLSGDFPVTERFSTRGLWLPSSPRLTDEDVVRVCDTVRGFYYA